jgi:predicted aspartyl protease
MPFRDALAILPLSFLGACSSSPSADNSSSLPPTSELIAFTHVTNILLAPVDIGGTTALLGVDTGDPFLFLNPASYPAAPVVGSVSAVSIGSDDLINVPVITSTESPPSPDPAVPLGGLLGCTVICRSVVSFNYRDAIFSIGSHAAPSGLMPERQFAFTLEGGGEKESLDGMSVTVPKSRVAVDVEIEGTTHRMILDTGATSVTVNKSVFLDVTKDGRVQLSGGSVSTTLGMSTGSFTRTKLISVGGVEATDVVIAYDASFDTNLDAVSMDAGETIEGSLGGTFLNNYYVTIDYPNQKVHLAPYADRSFILDPGISAGFALQMESDGSYVVSTVFSGTEAVTKGVSVGDAVVAIDGQKLASLTVSEIGILGSGNLGATKSVTFGAAKNLANQTVSFALTNLLPLAQ